MPLNPTYVQEISMHTTPSGQRKQNFVNISSQMMNPGLLPSFFAAQNTAVEVKDTVFQTPNMYPFNQREPTQNFQDLFRAQTPSKMAQFRTASMKAWNVPQGLTEIRAGDFT